MSEANKALVQSLFDVWNTGVLDTVDELYAEDFVADYRPYAPLRHEEILILRIRNGQVVWQRGIADNLNALRQLGVMPTPPRGGSP